MMERTMPPSASEIMLFLRALPIARASQDVRRNPLHQVIQRVRSVSVRTGVRDPDDAVRAAARVCSRWARWFGGIDTCLTRSLVAGALLSGRHEVMLHVGFRPTDRGAEAVDGHAWLVVDGEMIESTGLDEHGGLPYESTARYEI
jgi:hypothetical protein